MTFGAGHTLTPTRYGKGHPFGRQSQGAHRPTHRDLPQGARLMVDVFFPMKDQPKKGI